MCFNQEFFVAQMNDFTLQEPFGNQKTRFSSYKKIVGIS